MAQAGIQPDADVDLQVVWWMAREAQRRERTRFAMLSAVVGGNKDSLNAALADEDD
jgi:hypothetical protein